MSWEQEWLHSLQKTGEWVPHMGTRGGMGAKNMRTGETVYGPAAQSLLQGGGGSRGAVTSVPDEEKETDSRGQPYGTQRDPFDNVRGGGGRPSGQGRSVEDYLAEQTGDESELDFPEDDPLAGGFVESDFPPDTDEEEREPSTVLDLQMGGERTEDILAEAESYGVDVSDLQAEYAKMQESGDTEFAHELEEDAMGRLSDAGFENEINEQGAWVVYEPRGGQMEQKGPKRKPEAGDHLGTGYSDAASTVPVGNLSNLTAEERSPYGHGERSPEYVDRVLAQGRRKMKAHPIKDGEEIKFPLGTPNNPKGPTIRVAHSDKGPMKKPKEDEVYYEYPEGSDRGKDSANEESSRGEQPRGFFQRSFEERLAFLEKDKLKEPGPDGPTAKREDERKKTPAERMGEGAQDIGHTLIGAGTPTTTSGAGAQAAAHQALGAAGSLVSLKEKQIAAAVGGIGQAIKKPIEMAGNVAGQMASTAQANSSEQQKGPRRHAPDCQCDECREQVIEDEDLITKPGPGHNHGKKFERLLSHVKQRFKDKPSDFGWAESGDEAAHRIAYSKLGKSYWTEYNGYCSGCFEMQKMFDDAVMYFEVMQKALEHGVIHEGALTPHDFYLFQQEYSHHITKEAK